MADPQTFDIEIDKLTRSIENAISGDSFKTEILELTADDLKRIKNPNGCLIGNTKLNKWTKPFINLL